MHTALLLAIILFIIPMEATSLVMLLMKGASLFLAMTNSDVEAKDMELINTNS